MHYDIAVVNEYPFCFPVSFYSKFLDWKLFQLFFYFIGYGIKLPFIDSCTNYEIPCNRRKLADIKYNYILRLLLISDFCTLNRNSFWIYRIATSEKLNTILTISTELKIRNTKLENTKQISKQETQMTKTQIRITVILIWF